MKATGFLQVVADRRPDGRARSLSLARVTQRAPRDPLPGALVVKVSLDIPDELAHVQTVEAAAKAGMLTLVIVPDEEEES
jgi:hypothetical protein